MQSVSSRIWTRVAVSISYDDNYNTTGTSHNNCYTTGTSTYLDPKHNVGRWRNKPRFNPSLEQCPVGGLGSRRGDINITIVCIQLNDYTYDL